MLPPGESYMMFYFNSEATACFVYGGIACVEERFCKKKTEIKLACLKQLEC